LKPEDFLRWLESQVEMGNIGSQRARTACGVGDRQANQYVPSVAVGNMRRRTPPSMPGDQPDLADLAHYCLQMPEVISKGVGGLEKERLASYHINLFTVKIFLCKLFPQTSIVAVISKATP
jgi:hypothetical protein